MGVRFFCDRCQEITPVADLVTVYTGTDHHASKNIGQFCQTCVQLAYDALKQPVKQAAKSSPLTTERDPS